ncbi:hypothetical protein [Rhodanobacter denitrificans]|uniref:hypothetical protein n=1 Tax=Rhodanobacter denitrificans TaxID=666685 RepID=UPI0012FDD65E|nr:hypothetical protein [Rhodanobacter denitrificans]UJM88309.1 hypothetical protein LRJ86_08515 [Rhodanobacter denitrificans]
MAMVALRGGGNPEVAVSVKDGVGDAEELRRYHGPWWVVRGKAGRGHSHREGRADSAAAGSADRTLVPVAGKSHVAAIWSVATADAGAAFFCPARAGQPAEPARLGPPGSASGAATPAPLMLVN